MLSHRDTISILASRLGYGEKELLSIIKDAPKYYLPFHMVTVKKDKSIKMRHIDNPHKKFPLRDLQKSINKQLLRSEISKLDSSLVGGIKKRSMLKHIEPHIGKKTVVCMDLSNCFPNISYKRIVETWIRLGYSDDIAVLLAEATTYRGYLPQGPPTSCMLCNFALNPMATEIRELMDANGINFTQYIDDITFSGDDDIVVRRMVDQVYKITSSYGQKINRSKTEIMDSKHRQKFMGIVVNAKTKVDDDAIKKIAERIKLATSDGFIDSFTNLSIGGQILHVRKFDTKAGDYLEKLFSKSVQNIYEGGSKSRNATVEPCLEYRRDKTHRAKCTHLKS